MSHTFRISIPAEWAAGGVGEAAPEPMPEVGGQEAAPAVALTDGRLAAGGLGAR